MSFAFIGVHLRVFAVALAVSSALEQDARLGQIEDLGQGEHEDNVQHGGGAVDLKGSEVVEGDVVGDEHQLHHADDGDQGRVLHQRDEIVSQRGKGDPNGLGNDDVYRLLQGRETRGVGRLVLTPGNRLEAGPEDLRIVGRRIQGQRRQAREEG